MTRFSTDVQGRTCEMSADDTYKRLGHKRDADGVCAMPAAVIVSDDSATLAMCPYCYSRYRADDPEIPTLGDIRIAADKKSSG